MTKISKIKVNLGNRSYPIHIANDLFPSFENHVKDFVNYSKVIIVTDNYVKKSMNENFFLLKKKFNKKISIVSLPPGEKSKSFKYLELLCEKILEKKNR